MEKSNIILARRNMGMVPAGERRIVTESEKKLAPEGKKASVDEGEKLIEFSYVGEGRSVNAKVFLTKTLSDLLHGKRIRLMPPENRIDLNGVVLYRANESIHLVKVVYRKAPKESDRIRHKHFVDIITGSEYCECNFKCPNTIPVMGTQFGSTSEFGIVDSVVNFLDSDEYVKMNSDDVPYSEKLQIAYEIVKRANAKYIGARQR